MKCKYVDLNREKNKCHNYYLHHEYIVMCRLPEWKKKKGTCPYDKNITSKPHKKVIKGIKRLDSFK